MGGFLTRGFDSERQEGVGHGVSIMRQSPLSSAMTAALTVRKAGPDTLGAERKIREGPVRGLPPPGRRGRPLGRTLSSVCDCPGIISGLGVT